MSGHKAYGSLIRDFLSGSLRRGYNDQVHLPHTCKKRAKGGLRVIPGIAYLRSCSAEIIKKNHHVILAQFLRIAIRDHGLPKQVAPGDEQLVQDLASSPFATRKWCSMASPLSPALPDIAANRHLPFRLEADLCQPGKTPMPRDRLRRFDSGRRTRQRPRCAQPSPDPHGRTGQANLES